MRKLNFTRRAFEYYRKSDTIYKVHSPFLYKFVKEVIENNDVPADLVKLKEWRNELRKLKNENVQWTELGATSKLGAKSKSKAVINRSISIPHFRGLWLYRLTKFLKAESVLELGTCIGISSLYLSANNGAEIITIEGQDHLVKEATKNFSHWNRKNIKQIQGDIPRKLRDLTQGEMNFDLIYVDAMHDSQKLEGILDQLEALSHWSTCIVFDDINWSEDMNLFWKNYQEAQEGAFVDLFHWGIHFKSPIFQQKTCLSIIPKRYKPLQLVL